MTRATEKRIGAITVRTSRLSKPRVHPGDNDDVFNRLLPRRFEMPRRWRAPLVLLSLSALVELSGLTPLLRFDRSAIVAGEWWRLVTGNLVHLGWVHFALNAAGLLLGWLLFSRYLRLRTWGVALLWCCTAVGGGLLLFSPSTSWYDGLSGALHGLFAIGALRSPRREERAFVLLIIAKVGWEQWRGDPLIGGLLFAAMLAAVGKVRQGDASVSADPDCGARR